jgi:hypothetical protein
MNFLKIKSYKMDNTPEQYVEASIEVIMESIQAIDSQIEKLQVLKHSQQQRLLKIACGKVKDKRSWLYRLEIWFGKHGA